MCPYASATRGREYTKAEGELKGQVELSNAKSLKILGQLIFPASSPVLLLHATQDQTPGPPAATQGTLMCCTIMCLLRQFLLLKHLLSLPPSPTVKYNSSSRPSMKRFVIHRGRNSLHCSSNIPEFTVLQSHPPKSVWCRSQTSVFSFQLRDSSGHGLSYSHHL